MQHSSLFVGIKGGKRSLVVLSVYCFVFCHTKSAVATDLSLVQTKYFKSA